LTCTQRRPARIGLQQLKRGSVEQSRPALTRSTDGWKLVCVENFTWMLFNLNEDPFEEANQA